jgi:hypothetical protein
MPKPFADAPRVAETLAHREDRRRLIRRAWDVAIDAFGSNLERPEIMEQGEVVERPTWDELAQRVELAERHEREARRRRDGTGVRAGLIRSPRGP